MVRPGTPKEDTVIETWAPLTQATTWVFVWDKRDDKYTKQYVGGNRKRLDLTRDDRKYNQELIPEENSHLDPFTNGSLQFVRSATKDANLQTRYHLTDAELADIFKIQDADAFSAKVTEIDSEVILRRVEALSETHGTMLQVAFVKGLIRERYPIGGVQKAIREEAQMFASMGIDRM